MNLRIFKCEAYVDAMERLRRHAVATAHVSRTVCRYTSIEGEFAFMAGLLHDVGIAGVLLALAERKSGRKTPPDLLAIWPAVDRIHARAGEIMARHWQLPAEIRFAISAHHQVVLGGHVHPLAATVALANELAHQHGAGLVAKCVEDGTAVPGGASAASDSSAWMSAHAGVDCTGENTLLQARAALGIDARVFDLIVGEAQTAIESLGGES